MCIGKTLQNKKKKQGPSGTNHGQEVNLDNNVPNVPAYSSLFKPIPAYSSLFQPVPAYSSLFQLQRQVRGDLENHCVQTTNNKQRQPGKQGKAISANLKISKFYPVQQKIWIGTIFAWLSLFVVRCLLFVRRDSPDPP